MTEQQQAAMRQAAEDVSKVYDLIAWGHTERAADILKGTRTALRRALEQQPAYRAVKTVHEGKAYYVSEPEQQPAPATELREQQEPVEYWTVADGWVSEQAEVPAAAWIYPEFWDHCKIVGCGTAYRLPGAGRQPLYTSPPASKPLTDEQERKAFEAWCFLVGLMHESHGIRSVSSHEGTAWEAWKARAAHGITKGNT